MAVLQTARQCHDALKPRLFLFGVQTCFFFCLLSSCLAGRSGFQFSSHALQIIWHLRICLEEEELQVSGLVLQLDLSSILQNIRNRAMLSEEGQDLAPVRALDHVQSGHECLFFFRSPGPSCRVQSFTPRCVGRLGDGGLTSLLVQGCGRQGLVWR